MLKMGTRSNSLLAALLLLVVLAIQAEVVAFQVVGDGVTKLKEKKKRPIKKLALLIGVEEYDKAGYNQLPYAEADVKSLAKDLKDCGFEVDSLLGSIDGNKRASFENIQRYIQETFFPKVEELNKNDVVIVFFSGHGQQKEVDGKEDAFFCPVDAHQSKHARWISIGEFTKELSLATGCNNNLILIDACRENRFKGVDGRNVDLLRNNMSIFYACSYGETAQEDPNLKHGVFTHFILEAMHGLSKNSYGEVTWNSMAGYVQRNVSSYTEEDQRPNLITNLSGAPPILRKFETSLKPAVDPDKSNGTDKGGQDPGEKDGGDGPVIPAPQIEKPDTVHQEGVFLLQPSAQWRIYNFNEPALKHVSLTRDEGFMKGGFIKNQSEFEKFWAFTNRTSAPPNIDFRRKFVFVQAIQSPRSVSMHVYSKGNGSIDITRDFTTELVQSKPGIWNAHLGVFDKSDTTSKRKARWGVTVQPYVDGVGMEVIDIVEGLPVSRGRMLNDNANYFVLEEGDVIISINGVATNSHEEFGRAMSSSPKEMSAVIKNVRNNEINTLYYTLSD